MSACLRSPTSGVTYSLHATVDLMWRRKEEQEVYEHIEAQDCRAGTRGFLNPIKLGFIAFFAQCLLSR